MKKLGTFSRGSSPRLRRRARVLGCLLALAPLGACNDARRVENETDAGSDGGATDAHVEVDGGLVDSGTADAGTDAGLTDAGLDDAGTPDASVMPGCTGDAPAALFANRTATDGTQHWLRRTTTATTYAIVPAGAPRRSALPQLFEVARFCGDQSALVLEDDAAHFARVDYVLTASLALCVSPDTYATAAAALAAPAANASASATTGCAGHPFTTLTVTP